MSDVFDSFGLSWGAPWLVSLLWVVLVVIGGLAYLERHGRGSLDRFLSPVMAGRLTARATLTRTTVQLALFAGCLICGVLALMRPQAPGEMETVLTAQPAADIEFVLDTSRSMLAEDVAPNRLARAKAEISQLVARLDGHRVGLIAFAGRAVPVCPLTPDHAFFNTVLGTVDTRSAGKGGTRVGEAIKAALRGFPAGGGAKLIVLITDGDDQDPYTQEAAQQARDAGVKIVVVGLGSEAGSTITLTDPQSGAKTTLMYEGKPVISKLDGPALQKLALTTEGAYVPAGTSAIDLDAIMESHVKPLVLAAAEAAGRVIPAERYALFVLASLAFLLAAIGVGAGAGDRRAS